MRALIVSFYYLLAAGSLANGAWMLLAPTGWFSGVPAAVADTGPLNIHFVLDLGVVFLIAGLGALWCARNLDESGPVHWGLTLFFGGHALVHVVEIVSGRLPASHWWIDLPLVFLPAVVLLAVAFIPLAESVED
jgi:hypothetical protein